MKTGSEAYSVVTTTHGEDLSMNKVDGTWSWQPLSPLEGSENKRDSSSTLPSVMMYFFSRGKLSFSWQDFGFHYLSAYCNKHNIIIVITFINIINVLIMLGVGAKVYCVHSAVFNYIFYFYVFVFVVGYSMYCILYSCAVCVTDLSSVSY